MARYTCQVNTATAPKCVSYSRFCDGRRDCPLGDDESECRVSSAYKISLRLLTVLISLGSRVYRSPACRRESLRLLWIGLIRKCPVSVDPNSSAEWCGKYMNQSYTVWCVLRWLWRVEDYKDFLWKLPTIRVYLSIKYTWISKLLYTYAWIYTKFVNTIIRKVGTIRI